MSETPAPYPSKDLPSRLWAEEFYNNSQTQVKLLNEPRFYKEKPEVMLTKHLQKGVHALIKQGFVDKPTTQATLKYKFRAKIIDAATYRELSQMSSQELLLSESEKVEYAKEQLNALTDVLRAHREPLFVPLSLALNRQLEPSSLSGVSDIESWNILYQKAYSILRLGGKIIFPAAEFTLQDGSIPSYKPPVAAIFERNNATPTGFEQQVRNHIKITDKMMHFPSTIQLAMVMLQPNAS
jgi:hypothetical protein